MRDPVAEFGDALWLHLKGAQPALAKRWRGYVVIERSAIHSDKTQGENAKIGVLSTFDGLDQGFLHHGYEVRVRLTPIDANGVELGPSRFNEAAAVEARCHLAQDGIFRESTLRMMDSVLREVEDVRALAAEILRWLMLSDEELGAMAPMDD